MKQPSPPPVFGPKQLMRAEEPNGSNGEYKTHMFKRIDVFSDIVAMITIN
jgi:hypothetical protein